MQVTLTFNLLEEVTPDLFAGKVALACCRGALRGGEGIVMPSDPDKVLLVSENAGPGDETVGLFG